jgi:uncharacterized membrane-anchored protein
VHFSFFFIYYYFFSGEGRSDVFFKSLIIIVLGIKAYIFVYRVTDKGLQGLKLALVKFISDKDYAYFKTVYLWWINFQ